MNKKLIFLYGCRIYSALISIILLPFIIKAVGHEAYGLIGFFVVLQACLGVLEAGIGGVLVRQFIHAQVSRESYLYVLKVFYKLFVIFLIISLIVILIGYFFSNKYSYLWLNTNLENDIVIKSTFLMFCIFAVKYLQCPYRSILLSNEAQITVSSLSALQVTISQPLALYYLVLFNGNIIDFFLVQLLGALFITLLMIYLGEKSKFKTIKKLVINDENSEGVNLKTIIYFSLQLSLLSILWILVTQSDKLTLTKFMPLNEYAYYSVAVSVSIILTIINEPVNQILLPRLTKLYAEKKKKEFSYIIANYFSYLAIILISLDILMFFYGDCLIFIWTGDVEISLNSSSYLPWLFIGTTFAIFSNFCFLILYSIGQLKKHTIVYFIFSLLVIPLNIFIAINYLGIGVAMFYAFNSGVLFVLWTGYNFKVYFDNGVSFLFRTICPLVFISVIYLYLSKYFLSSIDNRFYLFVILFVKGSLCVFLNYLYLVKVSKIKLKEFKG